jgi:hypothetical protein
VVPRRICERARASGEVNEHRSRWAANTVCVGVDVRENVFHQRVIGQLDLRKQIATGRRPLWMLLRSIVKLLP